MANGDNLTNSFDSLFNDQSTVDGSDITSVLAAQTKLLKSIDESIRDLSGLSQGRAQSDRYNRADWRDVGRQNRSGLNNQNNQRNKSFNSKTFTDGLEEVLLDAIGASDFKKDIQAALKVFSNDLGMELSDIPNELGKELGKQALSSFSSSKIGKPISDAFNKWKDNAVSSFKDAAINSYSSSTGSTAEEIRSRIRQSRESASSVSDNINSTIDAASTISDIASASMTSAAGTSAARGSAAAGASAARGAAVAGSAAASTSGVMAGAKAVTAGLKAVPGLGTAILALGAIEILTEGIFESVGDVAKSFSELGNGLTKAANRDINSRQKMTENANKRLTDDLESIITSEFDILEKAADRMIAVWEDNLAVINQTQGYSKAELQDLISDYATKIRAEGLESVVSVADFTGNLGSVLKSGISGQAANEFAYLATKLNAAIPTQDFFQYSDTYASLIGNAIKDGKSQSEAIKYANKQLETFASEVLYASRQLSGGLNVGLQNASDLFKQATEISVAAKTGDPSQIASVLTSVSAITGSIAPDLANSVVEAIYNAATGGNNSQIVALRSLAGINASNTEFLRQFASNPQTIFSTLFKNLANLQNMSSDNYMEVAEGLSNVFGISKDSFARVDFNYLAQAVDSMNVTTASLEENMTQLASGESTLSAEQMRIRQINEYMIDEGLSYVLDNEVARAVQQHMWQEQLANEMMENTYSVDIQGSFAELFTNLLGLVQNIASFLFPIYGIGRAIANLSQTNSEVSANNEKVAKILESGKVGTGNTQALHNLTTRNADLKLTNSYLSELIKNRSNSSMNSANYIWGSIGKSQYASLGFTGMGSDIPWSSGSSSYSSSTNVSKVINLQKLSQNFNKMQDAMSQFFGTTLSDSIESAIKKEQSRIASASIKDEDILKRAQEYLQSESSAYFSKLGSSEIGKTFDAESEQRQLEAAKERAKSDLLQEQQVSALQKATDNIMKQVSAGKFGESGYEAWKGASSKYGLSDFESAIAELGYVESDVKTYFEALEAKEAAKSADQRNKDEETFWAESQRYLNLINANIHDVFDKGDIMGVVWPGIDSWLADIDSSGSHDGSGFRADMYERLTTVNDTILQFRVSMESQWAGFRKDWTDYYIRHTTYTQHLTGTSDGKKLLATLDNVKNQKDKTTEDVLNALTEALVSNPVGDLLDPTVQQNLFLSAILQGVQTIIQQNNTQGKLKLPDAISALATGMTVTDTTAANAANALSK